MRLLSTIAYEIERDWITGKGQRIVTSAFPYLVAMKSLGGIDEMYGCDSGRSIVLYFLANAGQWRGECAREIKKELNLMLK